MTWVRFTAEHNWTPPEERRVSILYQPSEIAISVRKDCADEAVRLKRAVRVKAPRRAPE
jgi:hypothetical protein